MEKEKAEKTRIKRQYAKRGSSNQKMMSFRLDNENAEWLLKQANKGRYINELIAKDRQGSYAIMKQTNIKEKRGASPFSLFF